MSPQILAIDVASRHGFFPLPWELSMVSGAFLLEVTGTFEGGRWRSAEFGVECAKDTAGTVSVRVDEPPWCMVPPFWEVQTCAVLIRASYRGCNVHVVEEQLIESIRQLSEALPVAENYEWDMPDEKLPITIPREIQGGFARNVYLRENLGQVLANDNQLKSHYWAIRDWGGITSFKKSQSNDLKIRQFLQHLEDNQVHSLDSISSLSKVAAFRYPNQYAIYDARTVYSLNWLIFRHTEDRRLFPQPESRNTELYGTGTLYRLSGLPHRERSRTTAYHEYCELIRALSQQSLQPDQPFYYLETALSRTGVRPLEKGRQPYQDAASLFDLRNALMHFKPEWDHVVGKHGWLERRLRGRFAESPFAAKGDAFFPKRCLGHGCAAWAVATAKTFYEVFMERAGFQARDFGDSRLYRTEPDAT